VEEFLKWSIHFQHTNSLLIWEIDIQVSTTGEDSIGAVGLQSPWLPPAMEPMLKEPQHHDNKLMTKILVDTTAKNLYRDLFKSPSEAGKNVNHLG
jgi:hypothetical protein